MTLTRFIERALATGALDDPSRAEQLVSLVRDEVSAERVARWLETLTGEDEDTLGRLAALMETHPLGFQKYVLWADEAFNGARARLHVWPKNRWPQENIHDHRFNFCATILCGGYVQERYEVRERPDGEGVEVTLVDSRPLHTGDTYYFPCGQFHRVLPLEEHSASFLVRSRAHLPFSRVVDPATLQMRRAYGAVARLERSLREVSRDLLATARPAT